MSISEENDVSEEEIESTEDDALFDMSDEDFAKLNEPVEKEEEVEETPTEEPEEEVEEKEEESEPEVETEEEEKEEPESDAATEEKEEETEVTDEKEEKPSETKTEIDYKAAYEKLTSKFKANGKELKVENVDQAISLMQQGANYNKKMTELKPHLKIARTLEENKIDAAKLNYLIDLSNKDPKAIAKLVKESGINPIDLDTEEGNDYKANNHAVSDESYDIREVIDEIKSTPTYQRLSNVLGNDWDEASRDFIKQEPSVMKVINDHMQTGIYDVVATEFETARALNSNKSLNDLMLYKQVADSIQAKGGFNHLFQEEQVQVEAPAPIRAAPKRNIEDQKLTEKRLAASPTKSKPSKNVVKEYDFLNMPDEEFEKLNLQ